MQSDTRRHLWGRKTSRPLKPVQKDLMDHLLPDVMLSLEPPLASSFLKNPFFEHYQTFHLEIGFGGGEHLAAQAKKHSTIGWIGCEPFINGVAKLLTLIKEQALDNIRIVQDDARVLVRSLPSSFLSHVFILFADPWPKSRHHKRRIIQLDFLKNVMEKMKVGGLLTLATDHDDYREWMLEHMHRLPAFRPLFDQSTLFIRPKDWNVTRYEEKAFLAGRKVAYMTYRYEKSRTTV